jgi:hypothetical protein
MRVFDRHQPKANTTLNTTLPRRRTCLSFFSRCIPPPTPRPPALRSDGTLLRRCPWLSFLSRIHWWWKRSRRGSRRRRRRRRSRRSRRSRSRRRRTRRTLLGRSLLRLLDRFAPGLFEAAELVLELCVLCLPRVLEQAALSRLFLLLLRCWLA